MTLQLQYIREELMAATSDEQKAQRGQLEGFETAALAETRRVRRKRRTFTDEEGNKHTIHGDPVPGTETRSRRRPAPPIEPVTYSTASWRRAVNVVDAPMKQWLLWCYTKDTAWTNQQVITQWGWAAFQRQNDRKVAKRTEDRLRALIWLCAQNVRTVLMGAEGYQQQQLAELVGVNKATWCKTYQPHWDAMSNIFRWLDVDALNKISRARKDIKTEAIAKAN